MKASLATALVLLTLSAQSTRAADVGRKNLQVFNDVSTAVNRYERFTIFDDVSAEVKDGVVTLTGKVTMPYKKTDIAKQVAKVDGVTQVVDKIEVLPVSRWDDQLRYRIARAIYGNGNFSNQAMMVNPPIHIIVENGRVTLTGVVQSEVDRALARSLASGRGEFSVKNELKTEEEVRNTLEKL